MPTNSRALLFFASQKAAVQWYHSVSLDEAPARRCNPVPDGLGTLGTGMDFDKYIKV
jgi:hypothetical protein